MFLPGGGAFLEGAAFLHGAIARAASNPAAFSSRACFRTGSPSGASVEHDHAANGLASLQGRKAFVDLIEPDMARDHLVEQELAIEIGTREQWKIARRARIAVADAA